MESSKVTAGEILGRLDKGEIGDEELGKLVKLQFEKRLQWGYKPTYEQQLASNLDFVISLKEMNKTGEREKTNNAEFYDEIYELPTVFLEIMHGKTLKQSACYFKDESTTLDEAEEASYELYCERAQIKDGQTILDIGSGQGGLVLHIAKKYNNCHVTGLTNSNAQRNYILMQAKILNLSNVDCLLGDVTKFDTEKKFDRIMIIQTIEHMKNMQQFLKMVSTWMKDEDSLLFVEHVCNKTFNQHFEALDEDDWYSRYLYPNGGLTLLSASSLLYFQDDVSVVNHWVLNGMHMAKSCDAWLKNLEKEMETALSILEPSLGSKEAANKLIIRTKTFCIGGYEQFSFNNGEEWMIAHFLFKKKY